MRRINRVYILAVAGFSDFVHAALKRGPPSGRLVSRHAAPPVTRERNRFVFSTFAHLPADHSILRLVS
jgi:hypothetical protein